MYTKSSLAMELSKLSLFNKAKVKLEQYPTDSEIAATVLWDAYMKGDIKGKTIADLGCGTGILGLGALLLGAKFVYFVDVDENVLVILKENLGKLRTSKGKYRIVAKDINYFNENVDTVIQNPPFGTREKHIDKLFLEKAFAIAPVIYSFHKITSKAFISALCRDNHYSAVLAAAFDFLLKASMKFHRKRIQYVKVGFWRMERI